MNEKIKEVQALGQSFWYDNIERGALESGEMQSLIDDGITGVTSNPTIFMKAITGSDAYDEAIRRLARQGLEAYEIYDRLVLEDIAGAADILRPVYDRTGGRDGYVSIEPNPALAYDVEGTVKEIRRLLNTLDRPNVMAKAPGTPEAVPAIEQLLSEGYNINITLLFSPFIYEEVANAYVSALEKLDAGGGDLSQVASVASFFVSRVDTAVDKQLEELIDNQGHENLKILLGTAAIANCKRAYKRFQNIFGSERFARLKEKGARVQRPLWASTSTKNPGYSDTMYVNSLIGPDTVNTLPRVTLEAFKDHGIAASTLESGIDDEAKEVIKNLFAAGIDLKQVTDDLLKEGVKLFSQSLDQLLESIDKKRSRILAE
ncbi:transaldolase [bacterium BMS3Abin01]|nr:transaldolase [bacterium BMS3Abin01]